MKIGILHTVGSPCGCAEAAEKGLKALGHQVIIASSEDIALMAEELSRGCDLIIDHTDTFRGRGLLRATVRLILEGHGARLVGSGAQACCLADNKIASKTCLGAAGIATPPGIVISSPDWTAPPWLTLPLVLKPAFEHMSRGVTVVGSIQEARVRAREMLDLFEQPIIAESYIQGKELAVSVLEGPEGLRVLPPLEWKLESGGNGFLTELGKLVEHSKERNDAVRATLSRDFLESLEGQVSMAFRALGLRDYARFDIKLTPGGTFYFLEANVTPSLEPLEALALSASWAGLDYPSLVKHMLSSALARYENFTVEGEATMTIELPTGPIKLLVPQGVHIPPPSTIRMAGLLDIQPGERVMELGCGTGILSIAAAKLGARHVVAVDIDTKALDITLYNARLNDVESQIEVRFGSWYEKAGDLAGMNKEEQWDAIIATPPQTPGSYHFGPRYGGPDGTHHLFRVINGARAFLNPQGGRLWLLAISLANPKSLLELLSRHFKSVAVVDQTERFFSPDEYESMAEGLFPYLLRLRSEGRADFCDLGDARHSFQNLFIRATMSEKDEKTDC